MSTGPDELRELIAGMKARGESTGNGELVEYADKLAALASEAVGEREPGGPIRDLLLRAREAVGWDEGTVAGAEITRAIQELLDFYIDRLDRLRTPPSHPAPEPERP